MNDQVKSNPEKALKQSRKALQRGFSLIELIVVLVILGLLAGVVAPRVMRQLSKGKASAAKVQIRELENALKMYYMDVGRYPSALDALVRSDGVQNWDGPYLEKSQLPKDPWGNDYLFRLPGDHGTDYDLWSNGADGREGGEGEDADVVSWK